MPWPSKAVHWLESQRSQSPDKPFFLYFAPGATHAPHHVPKAVERQIQRQIRSGMGQAARRNLRAAEATGRDSGRCQADAARPGVSGLGFVAAEQKRVFARQMEVFAGFLENADYQIGRVISAIEEQGQLDNTLVLYIFGDNGASMEGTPTGTFNEIISLLGVPLTAEQQLRLITFQGGIKVWGGPSTEPHYASAWGWAGNTPFPWGKQVASHLGGIRCAAGRLVAKTIKDKAERSQPIHARDRRGADDSGRRRLARRQTGRRRAADADARSQLCRLVCSTASAKSPRSTQYFAILGNRSIYKDGWLLSARLPKLPWDNDARDDGRICTRRRGTPTKDPVELYNLDDDFSQSEDVAAQLSR